MVLFMTVTRAILYGLLQGFTEFLPVSSSGHLALMQNFFGAGHFDENYLAFTVFLHLGTLFAVTAVYYKEVGFMLKSAYTLTVKVFRGKIKEGTDKGEKLFLGVLTATVPLIAAVFIGDKIEFLASVGWAVGLMLVFNGIILYAAGKIKPAGKAAWELKPGRAFFVGLIQLIGVTPGISRSGSTITGGLLAGLDAQEAVKFSFLLSIPAIAGANIFEVFKLYETPLPPGSVNAIIWGTLGAAVAGFAAVGLLKWVAKKGSFSAFALYSVILGGTAAFIDIFVG